MKTVIIGIALSLLTGCVIAPIDSGYGPPLPTYGEAYGPPPLGFQRAPDVIVLPDTDDVYVVPDISVDLFFWNGWWWRPSDGRWYRSHYYDRGWTHYSGVPSFYYDVDPGWRQHYKNHNWYGHQWNYERIPNQRLQQNWEPWHKNRHWEQQRTWGVQGYRPRPPQQREELRHQRQEQYQRDTQKHERDELQRQRAQKELLERQQREKEELQRRQREKDELQRQQRQKDELQRQQREREELQHQQRQKEELKQREREQKEVSERQRREKENLQRKQREELQKRKEEQQRKKDEVKQQERQQKKELQKKRKEEQQRKKDEVKGQQQEKQGLQRRQKEEHQRDMGQRPEKESRRDYQGKPEGLDTESRR